MDKLKAFAVLTGAARVGADELARHARAGVGNTDIKEQVEHAIQTLSAVLIKEERPVDEIPRIRGNVTRLY